MKRIILVFLFLSIVQLGSNAQCIPDPDITFGTSCSTAPVLCPSGYNIMEFCGSTEPNPFGPQINEQPSGFCGIVDNPLWVGFVAATPSLELYILVENCQITSTGGGMQAAVYEGCEVPFTWNQVGPCVPEIYPNSFIYYSLNSLNVGQTYYLLLDGWNGDICDFTVEITSGAWAGYNDELIADAGDDIINSCSNTSTVLDASNSTFPSGTTFSWLDQDENLIGNGMTVTVNQNGIYYLELIGDPIFCPSRDTVIVYSGGLTSLELGEGTYLDCNTGVQTIEGEFVPMGPAYTYQWSTINGNILTGADTPTPVVNAVGEYVLTIFDIVEMCGFSDTISVYQFDEILDMDSVYQFPCWNYNSFFLNAADLNVNDNHLTYLWTTNDGVLGNNVNNLSVFIQDLGTYNITITDTLSGCVLMDSIVVQEDSLQNIPQVSFVGDPILSCINSQVVLTAENSTIQSPVTFRWENSNGSFISSDTTATISQPGIYTLMLRRTSLCVDTTQIEVIQDITNPIFTFNNPVIELNCNNNFTQNVTPVFQNNNINVTYQWTDGSGFSSSDSTVVISGNVEGTFKLVVTNVDNGCTFTEIFDVVNNGFEMEISTTDANCDMPDGTATVNTDLINSSVEWSNGGQGSTFTGLAQGNYSVTVTDLDNNCSKHQNFFIDEDISCKVVISGYVVNDPNMVCTYDSTMEGIETVMIKLEPLGIYTFTDSTGYYEFVVDDGMYLVQYVENDFVDLQCPIQGAYIVELNTNGTSSDDNHFFVKRKTQDLCLTKFSGNAAVGRNQFNCVQVCNYGVTTENAIVTFVHDSIFSEVTPLPNIIPINSNALDFIYDEALQTFTWNVDSLLPGQCKKIMFSMETPTTAVIGDTVHAEAKVTPIEFDVNPNNNCLSWNAPVTASFDPNDKRNFIGETPWGGNIYEDDTTMEYAIRFQNTGTDTAYTVVIRDTLDDVNLDVTSLRGFNSSHDMQVQFEGTNVLIFNFENIMLVDSMTNEEGSKGWVTFNIDLQPDLPLGTEIKNGSAIYFDYNEPILTNEVVNIIDAHFLKIEGLILNDEMDEVENVNIMLSGGASETIVTDQTGIFSFRDLVENEDYDIHFEKDIYPLNGVTTYDIVNIHQHILGMEFLDSPYKILAADVNNSGTITALDIIQIRNLILLNTSEFPYSPSWKFVDGEFDFIDPTQPFNDAVSESFSFQNLIKNKNLNVVGIKMGDVNITSDPNNLQSVDTRSKEGFLSLSVDNQGVMAGGEIVIGFAAKDFNEMMAYQFTLDFENQLKYIGFESGVLPTMNAQNLGLRFLENGQMTVAWASSESENIEDGEPLFFLKFQALQNGELRDMININSTKTEALAYDNQEQIFDVKLSFENKNQTSGIQIFPNPAKENIYLNFNLQQREVIGLEIYNAFGQLEKNIFQNRISEKGFFQQNINVKYLSKGTYFIKIKIGEKVMVRKIVIL